jgi:hypothetical protein
MGYEIKFFIFTTTSGMPFSAVYSTSFFLTKKIIETLCFQFNDTFKYLKFSRLL